MQTQQDLEKSQKQLKETQHRLTEAEERADEAEIQLRKLNAQEKALQDAEMELHNCQQKLDEKEKEMRRIEKENQKAQSQVMELQKLLQEAQTALKEQRENNDSDNATTHGRATTKGSLLKKASLSIANVQGSAPRNEEAQKLLDEGKPLLYDSLAVMKEMQNQIHRLEEGTPERSTTRPPVMPRPQSVPTGSPNSKTMKALIESKDESELLRKENASLYSKLLQSRGNILVVCRVRPFTDPEISKWEEQQQSQNEGKHQEDTKPPRSVIEVFSDTELGFYDSSKLVWRPFVFDKVLPPDSTQQHVVQELGHLAQGVLEGYNACVFAYGITGSGKTHSMSGPPDNPGLILRMVDKVLDLSREATRSFYKGVFPEKYEPQKEMNLPENLFTVKVSIIEIYNEEIRDLLGNYEDDKNEIGSLDTRFGPPDQSPPPMVSLSEHGGFKANTRYFRVSSTNEMEKLLHMGFASRATAATNVHEHSSRSHLIVCVDVHGPDFGPGLKTAFSTWSQLQRAKNNVHSEGNSPETDVQETLDSMRYTNSCLYLVDLAGSERVRKSAVTGDRLREAQHINRSLSALGDVLEALDKKASHIPYRNSKLSYLLQDALGGNARTAMLCNVGPSPLTAEETLYSLQFAARTRRIDLKPAQRMVNTKNVGVECRKLRKHLAVALKQKETVEAETRRLKEHIKSMEERLRSYSVDHQKESDAEKKALADEIVQLKEENANLRHRLFSSKGSKEQNSSERLRREAYSATLLRRENEALQAKVSKLSSQLQNMSSISPDRGTPEQRGNLPLPNTTDRVSESKSLTEIVRCSKNSASKSAGERTHAYTTPTIAPTAISSPAGRGISKPSSAEKFSKRVSNSTEDKIDAARRRREEERKRKVEAIKRRNARHHQQSTENKVRK